MAERMAVSPREAYEDIQANGAFLLDVRGEDEYAEGHAPGAVLIPLPTLSSRSPEIPEDRTVYVMCAAGVRSQNACQQLRGAGRTNVVNVDGGIRAWEADGLPVERGGRTTLGNWAH